jgi:hypothetical protein
MENDFKKCSICGKKLIRLLPNGTWEFLFGRYHENEVGFVPVELLIHGQVKMRCISRDCRHKNPDHWNVMQLFSQDNVPESKPEVSFPQSA